MLEPRFSKVAVHPAEVEQTGADDRHQLRIERQRDRADRRTLAIREVERSSFGTQREPARLRQRGRRRAAIVEALGAAARETGDFGSLQIEHADLMRAGNPDTLPHGLYFAVPRPW